MGDVVEGAGKVPSGPMPSTPPKPSSEAPSTLDKHHGGKTDGVADLHGKAVALSPEQINALERRSRAAVFQNYANRLPKEFRQQVSDYYEVLAE
jgi:hypothetical protein